MNGVLGEQALVALQRRQRRGLLPERGLDPTTLDPRELEPYALVSRPSAALPLLLDGWFALYRGVDVIVLPQFCVAPTPAWQPGPLGQHSGESQQGRAGMTRWSNSRNWSGAVLMAHDAELFRRVTASWVVPAPGSPRPGSASTASGCSRAACRRSARSRR